MTMFQNGKMMPTTPNRKTNFSFLENEDFNPEILIVVGAAQTTLSDKFSSYINRNKEKHNIIFEAELELNLNPSIFGNSHSLYLEGWRKEEYHKAIEDPRFAEMVGYRMTRERHESLDENEISKSKWDALPLSERLNLARNKVDEKYYYVGGSAYLMFDFSMESIKYYIENGINRIFPDTGHFFSDILSNKYETVNALKCVFKANGNDEDRNWVPISEFATLELFQNFSSTSQFLNEAMISVMNMSNPKPFCDWMFRAQVLFQIRQNKEFELLRYDKGIETWKGTFCIPIPFREESLSHHGLIELCWCSLKVHKNEVGFDAVQVLPENGLRILQIIESVEKQKVKKLNLNVLQNCIEIMNNVRSSRAKPFSFIEICSIVPTFEGFNDDFQVEGSYDIFPVDVKRKVLVLKKQ